MRIKEFRKLIYKKNELMKFLIAKNILRVPMCNKCNIPMTQKRTNTENYRCYLRRDGKKCSYKGTIMKQSVFKNSKLSIEDLLILLCEWVKGSSNLAATLELDIGKCTVSRWFTRFNNAAYVCYPTYINNQRIGGVGCIVEIDKTLLVKSKNHAGGFFNIKYGQLEAFQNFVDNITGAHTQTIEGMWSVLKRELRKSGTSHGTIMNLVRKYIGPCKIEKLGDLKLWCKIEGRSEWIHVNDIKATRK
ncbi:DDE-TNP-IS1595 domain-containing protein [Vairimorpha necatrix]|uniref:DDE-TNP-IS1595 domain-containing protein n=1 Tax=Vairimorpha necatrix TaxID=6039 RepID=A0AAX4JBJ9_9MICR